MNKLIRHIGTAGVVALWLVLVGFAWFGQRQDISLAEKRELAQLPELSAQSVFGTDGTGAHPFMAGFEAFSLDQFPLRDDFRSLKAMFHTWVLGAKDNNGYYYKDGYLAKQDLVLSREAVDQKLEKLNALHGYLEGKGSYFVALVPDKSYYLSEKYGYPGLDYGALESMLRAGLPWAKPIDLSGTLSLEDFYRTDTHWRQEKLVPTARYLCQAMGGVGPTAADFTAETLDFDFYGVYYAQAGLPVGPDELQVLVPKDPVTVQVDGVPVKGVYDLEKLKSEDPYHIYLSGAKTGFVEIKNPNARQDKTLVVVRDSFGSSLGALLSPEYSRVILVDLRVFSNPQMLPMLVGNTENADVLVLLSALSLNSTESFK